jgi:UDP-N-acetylglucosamine--N-acetylmuramyl-(pentapeptide) pyrophosphoryl-undecaprenol N-acetylglucosamine transferase
MRALRVLLFASDGLGAGHVVRALAIARGLSRRCSARKIGLECLLATTSDAFALARAEPVTAVHLPGPDAARRGGIDPGARRRIVGAGVQALADTFAPDLFVCDTFPSGPHGEIAELALGRARRALVRRHVREARAADPALAAGMERYDLAIVADDPVRDGDPGLPVATVRVPPITLTEPGDAMDREAARRLLGLSPSGRAVLVASGGGGDPEALERAQRLALTISEVAADVTPVLAIGPLGHEDVEPSWPSIRVTRRAPLAPLLAAFDGAFAAAGYNTAHELAGARVPAALFAQDRPFDDQRARIDRFQRAALARALEGFDGEAARAALRWMATAPRPGIASGGADRAADALLDIATGAKG